MKFSLESRHSGAGFYQPNKSKSHPYAHFLDEFVKIMSEEEFKKFEVLYKLKQSKDKNRRSDSDRDSDSDLAAVDTHTDNSSSKGLTGFS